jgi:hypothetical protein
MKPSIPFAKRFDVITVKTNSLAANDAEESKWKN